MPPSIRTRFPHGTFAREIENLYTIVAAECQRLRDEDEFAKQASDDEPLRWFELGQVLVTSGSTAEGRKYSLQAAEKLPGAPSPLNNASLAYAVEGDLDKALALARQVLDRHPQNFHARGNAVQYLVRLGRPDEAKTALETLIAQPSTHVDYWIKTLEACAFAGEETLLLEVYDRASKALKPQKEAMAAIGLHHAAVAYARQGDQRNAKLLWKAALKQQPTLSIARDNLNDLAKPAGQRNGPWHFPMQQWIPLAWSQRLVNTFRTTLRNPRALERHLQRLFKAIPSFKTVFSIMLDRGDAEGREYALNMAEHVPTDGLREFALSSRGTDEMRQRAARICANRGEIDRTQPVPLYVAGKQDDLLLMDLEIYSEPVESDLPDEARDLLDAASDALYANQPEAALQLLEAGLKIVPDERTFLNQTAAALMMLKRNKDGEAVIRHMVGLYPDYLFARCAMAQLCAREKKLDEADEWLRPLQLQSRFHISEFRAMAYAHSEVLKARKDFTEALRWIEMVTEMESELED